MQELMVTQQWTGAIIKHVQRVRYGTRRLRHDVQLNDAVVLAAGRLLFDQRLPTTATYNTVHSVIYRLGKLRQATLYKNSRA